MTRHAVVVGGGIIGLSTCFEFQDAGFEVTLVDPEPFSGATHHAGGMLAPTAEVQYQQHELVPLMKESAALYPRLIERVEQYTNLPTGYRTEGTLLVGADRADGQHLSEFIDYVKAADLDIEPLTSRHARQLEPGLSPRVARVARIGGDHQLDPRLFARALYDAVRSRGARHIKDSVDAIAVHSLSAHCDADASPSHVVVLSSGERITVGRSDVVVLAAGLGAMNITGWFEDAHPLQLRPVYGDVVRVRVPKALQPLTTRVIRGFVEDRPIYVIPRDDGTVTIGATSREDHPYPRTSAIMTFCEMPFVLSRVWKKPTLWKPRVGPAPGPLMICHTSGKHTMASSSPQGISGTVFCSLHWARVLRLLSPQGRKHSRT